MTKTIGATFTTLGNTATVTSIRDGWVWVIWRTASGARGAEVPYCRA